MRYLARLIWSNHESSKIVIGTHPLVPAPNHPLLDSILRNGGRSQRQPKLEEPASREQALEAGAAHVGCTEYLYVDWN